MSFLRHCSTIVERQLVQAGRFSPIFSALQLKSLEGRNYDHSNTRGHKNFGHGTEIIPSFTKFFHLFLGTVFIGSLLDFKKIKNYFVPKVDADIGPRGPEKTSPAKNAQDAPDSDQRLNSTKHVKETGKNKQTKEKIGFRERKIKEYENKIRQFSAPDKTFRYFATIRLPTPTGGTEIYMTPDDFLRAIYPGLTQPEERHFDFHYLLVDTNIIEYENRIRQYSTPDKIFRYFATVQVPTSDDRYEVFMTPTDFLTSMTPGIKQPEGLGLDQYRRYDPKSVMERLDLHLEKDSIFYKLGSFGLISFSDYIFLLTVLSTSRRHFEVAFRMFDLNGDGDVDSQEFENVATLVRQQTSIGNRHRDYAHTGSTFKGVNSALTTYFFGPKMDKKLTIEKFLEFQKQLQQEMLSLEFQRKNPNDEGKISEADFADLMLAYAGYTDKKKQKMIKRIKRHFRDKSIGISKSEYLDFFHFLNNINDVDTALTFYHIAGASIDQATLKHVAKTVTMVNLSDHVIDAVFTIFDENQDGELSNKEFVSVMKNRVQRGLERPKDTGFVKLMHSIIKCAKEAKPVLLDI